MKVCVVHVTAEEVSGPYTELIAANFERSKAEGTKVVHKWVAHLRRATDTVFAYPTLFNRMDVVDCAVEAEAEGCDAVMVACSGDPGVVEARTVVSIPVVGPMEAALHLACTYGHGIGIVTVADSTWSAYMRMAVHTAGLNDRFVGLAQIDIPSKLAFTRGFVEDRDIVMGQVAAKAEELVAAGAEAIVIGSAGLSVMATTSGLAAIGPEGQRAPIFDCLTVGLKTAELKADLQRRLGVPSTSGAGYGAPFGAEQRLRVDRLYGRAPSAEEK